VSTTLCVYFVRHGETAWSVSKRHTGRTDLPLTPHGEQMARELAPALGVRRYTEVWTSPRLRARMTCDLAGLGQTAQVVPDLSEWDYGDYEGLRTTEITAQHPNWDVWRDGCPGGERPMQVCERADRLIERLRGLSGNVALFSHGQFGRLLAARWIGLAGAQGQHFALDPASVSVLGFEADHPQRRVIALWNARACDVDVQVVAQGLA